MSRNASPIFFWSGWGGEEGALRDIQKTAARETNTTPQLPLTFLLLSGDLQGGNDKNKLSGKRPFLRMPFCVMFNHDRRVFRIFMKPFFEYNTQRDTIRMK